MNGDSVQVHVLRDDHPGRRLFSLLGNRWVCPVILALEGGPRRHSELRMMIGGVSQKMLTQTLRLLEEDGLVARTIIAGPRRRVDYELTPLGVSFGELHAVIYRWAVRHEPELARARAAYAAGARKEAK
ncbi:helix-turn-helix transcriptional regulator [Actinomadura barringtoniae]|uniref:Helix-turn-helix transcriptional regulator n=1 Tax=Actinomadura barringtoniae TaxID=1427535 RepID=A0A939T0Q0_9ACTN|nr:helix-turn-helix domain-containing protein [Actinomadura barringtoniae]MBO2445926.1 helix-turn-helix transcriptional regulator [Actinomadura barringtoniae]